MFRFYVVLPPEMRARRQGNKRLTWWDGFPSELSFKAMPIKCDIWQNCIRNCFLLPPSYSCTLWSEMWQRSWHFLYLRPHLIKFTTWWNVIRCYTDTCKQQQFKGRKSDYLKWLKQHVGKAESCLKSPPAVICVLWPSVVPLLSAESKITCGSLITPPLS